MKSKKATRDRLFVPREQGSHETVKLRSIHDPLLLTILGTAIGLAVLVVGIAVFWGSGPVIAEIPWSIPMVAAFVSLASLCVAFLAFGRYQVLGDPVSFWVGMGFASLGIGQLFYVLAWPGLLPDGGAIIARLPNTPAFINDLNLTLFGGLMLAAVLIRWPGKQTRVGRRWPGAVAAWLFFFTLISILIVSFEQSLPMLVRANGTFTPLRLAWEMVLLLLFAAGSFLSTRYYRHARDALAGYVAFAQLALVFLFLMTIIGGKRYDLWWYLQRAIGVGGYLIVLLGLLSEYVRLLRRESEGRLMLEAILENIPMGLTITGGPPSFPLVKVSRLGLEMNQRPAERLIGSPSGQHQAAWRIFLPDGVTQPLPEHMPLYRASRFGEETRNLEMVMEAQDGRKIPVLINAAPIRDATGQIVAAINTWLDITGRKQAEEALQRSQRTLIQAGRMARLGAWESPITRPDSINDNPLYWSEEVFRLFGYAPGEVEVSNELFFSHVPPEDRPPIEQAIAKAIAEHQVYTIEHRIIRADGVERIVSESAEVQYDQHGKPVRVIGAVQDITERKRAEAALRESEARNRQILESIPGMVFTTRPDGYCDYQSQQWVDYSGVPMSNQLGDGWNRLLHPEDQPLAFAAWLAAVEGRAPYNLEYRVRRHDGAYEWFKVIGRPIRDETGQIVRWFGVAMNIEELKRAEEELRLAYGQLQTIFDHRIGGIGIVISNSRGDVLQANNYYLNMLGYTREELLAGQVDWRQMTPPEWLPADENGLQQLQEWGVCDSYEKEYSRRDGSRVPVLITKAMMPGNTGDILSFIIDITTRKRAEEALQKYASELEHANRDLQNFTVMASHDLQEPLRKIEALGDTVLHSTSNLDEHLIDRIQRMRKSAQQMRKMVDALLQLSLLSTDTQSFQPVDLHQTTLDILIEKKEHIQQSGGVVEVSELPVIEADPLQMRRLLQHLIENALKFQPPGAKPRIKVSSKFIASGSVQILIDDNGIGFDEAHAGQLFEPFERLVGKHQPQYDGIGMGLAICRWIVERHGGNIAARSKTGQGTTFIVTLPAQRPNSSRNETEKGVKHGNTAIAAGR